MKGISLTPQQLRRYREPLLMLGALRNAMLDGKIPPMKKPHHIRIRTLWPRYDTGTAQ